MAVGGRPRMDTGCRSGRRGCVRSRRSGPRGSTRCRRASAGCISRQVGSGLAGGAARRDPEIPRHLGPGAAVWNGFAVSADRARHLQRLQRFPCEGASNARLSRWQNEIHWRGLHQRRTPALRVAVSGACRDDLGARHGNRVFRCVLFVDSTLALTWWVRLCIALSSVRMKLGQRC
jgi:hypothetical protein